MISITLYTGLLLAVVSNAAPIISEECKTAFRDLGCLPTYFENITWDEATAPLAVDCANNKNVPKIVDISSLKACGEGITHLDLEGNFISSLEGLERMLDLQWLSAYDNRVTSVLGLHDMTKMETLILDFNPLTTFRGLGPTPLLKELSFARTGLTGQTLNREPGIESLKPLESALGQHKNAKFWCKLRYGYYRSDQATMDFYKQLKKDFGPRILLLPIGMEDDETPEFDLQEYLDPKYRQ